MVGWARGSRIPLEGQRFGWLTVIEHVGSSRDGSLYRCKCRCGGEKIAASSMLKRGKVKSCGCMKRGPKPKRVASATASRQLVRRLLDKA